MWESDGETISYPLAAFLDMRKNIPLYFKLCNQVLRKAIAQREWAKHVRQKNDFTFDEFVTESTEAFFLVVVENSYERWKWLYRQRHEINKIKSTYGPKDRSVPMKRLCKGKDDPCPDALYTSGHATKRNSGWNDAGIKRYNEFYDAVIADREINDEAFEIHIVEHFKSAMESDRK